MMESPSCVIFYLETPFLFMYNFVFIGEVKLVERSCWIYKHLAKVVSELMHCSFGNARSHVGFYFLPTKLCVGIVGSGLGGIS